MSYSIPRSSSMYSKVGVSRREMLFRCANGFGGLALAGLLAGKHAAASTPNPLAPRTPHFAPKAKSVIFLFMDGGPSQMDTFDPKPRLEKESGQSLPFKPPTTVFNISDKVLPSPFAFKKYGQSGAAVSELFPHVATCVDDMAIIRSMVADHSEHTAANYFMHSGSGFQGRPSMGGWVTYGLGSECDNLPGFIVLESGLIPPGGLDLFGSGFLPATYQGHAVPQRRASHRRPRAARSYCRAAAEQAEPAAHVERGRARPLRRGQRNGSHHRQLR